MGSEIKPSDGVAGVTSQYFQTAGPEVVHETVDEETIIVNLETGSYYDLNHSGACIFNALAAGAGVEAALAEVCSRYRIDHATAAPDLEKLLSALIEEELIVPVAVRPGTGKPPEAAPRSGNGASTPPAEATPARLDYVPPALGKYTDMQEVLLLDPVHEVDEAGWPRTA